MLRRKGKIIVVESDEEIDSYPNFLRAIDPQNPSSNVGPYSRKNTLRYSQSEAIPPPYDCELNGNRGGQASGSGENRSSDGTEIPGENGGNEESNSELSRPAKKRNLGHRMKADFYPIDYLKYATTHSDLFKLRTLYQIPNDVFLTILGKIVGGMHLALSQLHPNGRMVLAGLFVLWEWCQLGKPSIMEIKSLYQLRSSPKESLGGDIHLPTRFVTPCRLFFFTLHVSGRHLFVSLTLSMFSDSWGLVSKLDDEPLLKVETALVNAFNCQDLLSPTSLVKSRLVDVVAGMDNKILSAMSRKRAQKKSNTGPSKTSAPALPPHPTRKNGGEKLREKSHKGRVQSRNRTLSPSPCDRCDHLASYKRKCTKSVRQKMVKDVESMDLGELGGSH
ncbi:hypothetical protein WN944_022481 [Citrus x changshan-huyou]|uniref:Uncharacterized protein n=1 Tax=Citrus x changshan-huyou TaxID=2935761 RepID=A0AAP0MYN9_9ROSI